ncbi:MAG: putative sulfate exporter family transporter [Xanthomonadaceae bacterium]|nr:putative sulfate exporter family transporter [Xanthomonadaceae bacterium]
MSSSLAGPLALLMGMVIAAFFKNKIQPKQVKFYQTLILQTAVVGLGAGIDFIEILKQGASSVPLTLAMLSVMMILGMTIARFIKVKSNIGWLISAGTAICGGSAIAAVAPAIEAEDDEIALSLAVVFSLNAIALIVFPLLGHALLMSEAQFGIFAALAIHDTSSVVGAASQYGAHALTIATTTKLVRALWIAPLVIGIIYVRKWNNRKESTKTKFIFPKFILYFLALSLLSTLLKHLGVSDTPFSLIHQTSKILLVGALFFVGLGVSFSSFKKVGFKVLAYGVSLWMISIVFSYGVIQVLVD